MKFPVQPSMANLAGVTSKKYGVAVKASEGDTPAEILIHGPIGRSFWSADGITGKEFIDALNKFPVGEKVTIGINSQGGAVGEGFAIFNAIQRRAADITCRIDGYAISIASVIPLAASKVVSPKSSIWMIHNAWSWFDGGQGNAEDMRHIAEMANKAADMLDKHDDVLVAAYVARSGKKDDEIRNAMAEETWLTGDEAVEWGFADEVSDDAADLEALDFSGMEVKAFKNIPLNCRSLILAAAKTPISALPSQGKAQTKTQTEENSMNRAQRIALLNSWGVMVKDEASLTDARIEELIAMGKTAALAAFKGEAAPAPAASNVIPLTKADVDNAVATAVQAAERRADCKASLLEMVGENRITKAQMDRVLKTPFDQWDAQIAALRENPIMPVAAEPVSTVAEITGDASVGEIEKHIDSLCKNQVAAMRSGNADSQQRIRNASTQLAAVLAKHRGKLIGVLNANTISANLKRNVILSEILRAFATRILPLRAFSTVFGGVRLDGTDVVSVPYFALTATASTDFNQANGYVMGDSAQDAKTVTVNKRKYQPIRFNSSELNRQPAINLMQIAEIKAEKLGVDVFTDVLSVVTAANFGAAAFTGAAGTFDSADIADLKGVCDVAEWPEAGRSLIVKSAYDVNLLKDSTVKSALNFGNSDPIQNGSVQKVLGFNYYMANNIPANAENLVGMCVFPSAILVALSPITPSDEVRNQLSDYQLVTDPNTGISFEYRRWGNADMDETREVIEANYGYGVGEAAALKRLVSA